MGKLLCETVITIVDQWFIRKHYSYTDTGHTMAQFDKSPAGPYDMLISTSQLEPGIVTSFQLALAVKMSWVTSNVRGFFLHVYKNIFKILYSHTTRDSS